MKAIKLKRIIISEEIFSITNDTIESIILGQLIYWQSRVSDIDNYINQEKARSNNSQIECQIEPTSGWIYKSSKELKSECMLDMSETTIGRMVSSLIEKGYISKRNNPLHKWDKILQYRVNMIKVINDIKKNGYDGLGDWTLQNDDSKSQNEGLKSQNEGAIPEITTEITIDTKKEEEKYKREERTSPSVPLCQVLDTKDNCAADLNNSKLDYNAILEQWKKTNPNLSAIRLIDEKRQRKIITLLKNNRSDINELFNVMRIIGISDFLQGKNDRGWTATFDWLINDTKGCYQKLLAGEYLRTALEKNAYDAILRGEEVENHIIYNKNEKKNEYQ